MTCPSVNPNITHLVPCIHQIYYFGSGIASRYLRQVYLSQIKYFPSIINCVAHLYEPVGGSLCTLFIQAESNLPKHTMLCLALVVALCLVHGYSADYIGAVVEYNNVPRENATLTVQENVQHYIYQIEQARGFGVQIIVFPEYGLTGLVDQPDNYAVPIPDVGTSGFLSEAYVLLELSNAAFEHELYIVANLLERANGTDNNTVYYNTNVVFASNGTLIAKYRKINLHENEFNLTPGNETSIFATSFGTFALLTGTDIWLSHPSQSVLIDNEVTDVIFVTAWNSTFPFEMSLSVQVGYALANRVNLLAANINNPSSGYGGSSIINSEGIVLRRILISRSATNIAYANVAPIFASPEPFVSNVNGIIPEVFDLSSYKNQTVFDYDSYVYQALNLSMENAIQEVCDGDFCCNFNITVSQNSSEVYRLVAFNGRSQFGSRDLGIKFCTVVACLNQDIATCGVRPSTGYATSFNQITVWGLWEALPGEFYRPVSVRGNLEAVFNSTYQESRTNETVGASFNMTVPTDNLVVFGLFVRSSAPESFAISLGLVAVVVAIQGIF